jgi:hypothetical protein
MEEIKDKVEQKIKDIKKMVKNDVIVKMRDLNGMHQIRDVVKGQDVVIVMYKDGGAVFLTYKQFLEKKVVFEG